MIRAHRYGRMNDPHHGNGWFVSWAVRDGFRLIAFRPLRWRVAIVQPQHKPGRARFYFGPFEFERATSKETQA